MDPNGLQGAPVFAYGSLMYPAVWEGVVAGAYAAAPATLRGYERRRIAGAPYPALVAGPPAARVRGVVYDGVSPADLAALDRFEGEGEAYARVRVTVERDDGRTTHAWTYLYLLAERVEPQGWDPDRFAARDLPRFLAAHLRGRAPRPPTGR